MEKPLLCPVGFLKELPWQMSIWSLGFAVLLHCSVSSHLKKRRYDIGEFGELLKTSEEQTQVNNCPGDELPRTRFWQQ